MSLFSPTHTLRIQAFSSGQSSASSNTNFGYVGFIGASLLLIAFQSVIFAGLDPTTDLRMWFVLSFELIGGLAIGIFFGFTSLAINRSNRRASLQREFQGALLGVLAGIVVLGLEMALLTAQYFFSTAQGVWLALLAPVAETMGTTVAVYHLIKSQFPEIHWLYIALPSDLSFAMFHYFAYGMRPDFLWVTVILALGNTVILWTYDYTRNATVPMVAHLVINIVPNAQVVWTFVLQWAALLIFLFGVLFIVYAWIGGKYHK